MYIPTNLQRWTLPAHYFGAKWPDYYRAGVGRTRDSKPLEESNFRSMLRALGGESETVIVVQESHWIEWIAIHESDEAALQTADKIIVDLEDYPVVNDEDFSQLEDEQICRWWEDFGLRGRIQLCADNSVSIFAARRDTPPKTVYEALRENL